jgi:hypothetical protein
MDKPDCWVKDCDGPFLTFVCLFQFPIHLLNPSLTIHLCWASADEQIMHPCKLRHPNYQLLIGNLDDRLQVVAGEKEGREADEKADWAAGAGGLEEILGLERLELFIAIFIKPGEFDQ